MPRKRPRDRKSPLTEADDLVRGLHRLTASEYSVLHRLYAGKVSKDLAEAEMSGSSPRHRNQLMSLFRYGYVTRGDFVDISSGEISSSYSISDDGVLRLLNPGLLLVDSTMSE